MPRPFPELGHPIVQAPLAGGPSTPELTAAVSGAGGLGFLAAGYKSAAQVGADIVRTRESTSALFGVNLFLLSEAAVNRHDVFLYARELEAEAERYGIELGEPRFEDDDFDAKLELVLEMRLAIVSFTFGCPSTEVGERLRERDTAVWVTVTDVEEALAAERAGADALIVQGVEAGGHRGTFEDVDGRGELALLPLLRLVASAVDLPLVAAGGIADGPGVAAALAAGASAAQIGTGFMLCPEAATSPAQRRALARPGRTALTRAFTGRRARGIVNRFMTDHDADAPSAYPHVHHLTAPLRAAARDAGDSDAINLWAGEAYRLADELPAAELVRRWSAEARAALDLARLRLSDQ
jgi:nitronate monooxygenase